MGMYSLCTFKLKLQEATPKGVQLYLSSLVDSDWDVTKSLPDIYPELSDDLFDAPRWYCLFGNFTQDEECYRKVDNLIIDVVSSLKAYDDIVPKFCRFIAPYLDTSFPNLVQESPEGYDYDTGLPHVYTILEMDGDTVKINY